MKKDNHFDIAIIGGGAQATAFISGIYSNFINKNIEKKIRIIVIDKAENHGCGKVYNIDFPCILMNTPSTDLSIMINDPFDFKKWLEVNSKNLELSEKNIEYVPRKVFGFYLKEKLEFFIAELKKKNIEILKNFILNTFNNHKYLINKIIDPSVYKKKWII